MKRKDDVKIWFAAVPGKYVGSKGVMQVGCCIYGQAVLDCEEASFATKLMMVAFTGLSKNFLTRG